MYNTTNDPPKKKNNKKNNNTGSLRKSSEQRSSQKLAMLVIRLHAEEVSKTQFKDHIVLIILETLVVFVTLAVTCMILKMKNDTVFLPKVHNLCHH